MLISGQQKIAHRIGSYYASTTYNVVYVPIPKNASMWASNYFKDVLKWGYDWDDAIRQIDHGYHHIWSNIKRHRKIVFLQDPLTRWIKGIGQFATSVLPNINPDNNELLDFLFAHIEFDEHTMPQVNFIHNLVTDNVDFFNVDSSLKTNLNNYLKDKVPNEFVPIPEDLYKNITIEHSPKYFLQNKIKSIIDENNTIKQRIIDYYHMDYKLLDNIKFYGS